MPLLKNIEKLGIALDTTHLSDRSFDQVRDLFGGRVLASHQNARKFCDWQRQFSDERIGVPHLPGTAFIFDFGDRLQRAIMSELDNACAYLIGPATEIVNSI